MKSKNAVLSLEHQVLRDLKMLNLQREKILIAVSGGVDSMVLLELLRRWQPYFRYEIAVAHVDHGRGNATLTAFRRRARNLVKKICIEGNLRFFTNENWPKTLLKSENSLREFRWKKLHKWQNQFGARLVAVAHHRDDQLETQILRLIRGTSRKGLKAMTHRDGEKIRPLLKLSREQILAYAKARRLTWCEDPSNKQTESMRNWLREEWLPLLEKRNLGAKKALARSLEMIAHQSENESESHSKTVWSNGGVRRKSLSEMTKKQQGQVMVEYLARLGLKQFQQSHVNEILRRLDTRRKTSTFSLLGLSWTIRPDLILASRV